MIKPNDIYVSISGTIHYVRVVDIRREVFKGEPLENTAPLYQIGLHRQQDPLTTSSFIDNTTFDTFSMPEHYFLETYKLHTSQPFYTPIFSFMKCLRTLIKGLT